MKRLTFLFVVCFTCLCSFSQINTTIWNVTINKSKKQQVINMLHNKGFKDIGKLDYDDVLYVYDDSMLGKIRFGGISWQSAQFHFFNSILYRIEFHRPVYYNDGQTNESIRKTVKDALAQKYSLYYWDEVNEYRDYQIWYNDNVLLLGFTEDDDVFTLVYCDNSTFDKMQSKNNNEF